MSISPWFIRHGPVKFTELKFFDDSGFKALEWLKNAQKGYILNIYGPVGCGKTSLVFSIAKALKYKVIEYESIQQEDLKTIGKYKSFENLKPLILVDESDITFNFNLQKFYGLNVPVILTSTNLINKDINYIKVQIPNSEIILNTARNILRQENRVLDDRFILRLCEVCNYDFRLVINYCQVFSKSPNIKDLDIVDKVASQSITSMCRTILNKRLSLLGLESIYSEKLMNLCLSSAFENNCDFTLLKSIQQISEFSEYPEKFKFASIDELNKIRADFIYKKEDPLQNEKFHGHEDPIHFLPLYNRNMHDSKSILHLQAIFNKYQIEPETVIDKEIKDYIGFTTVESRIFKFRYNMGSSSAVKRDITLKDLLNI